jgi:fatty-acyl-CoA synthase
VPDPMVPDIGLGATILRRAALNPALPALSFEGETQDYAQLAARIRRLGGALRRAGVNRGDRVAFLGFNHPVFLEALFAAASLGALFVPLNFRLTGPELEYIINDAGVHTLISDGPRAAVIDPVRARLCCRHYIGIDAVAAPWQALEEFTSGAQPLEAAERVAMDDVAIIMYTSGTTGRPKGAMLTHGNFFWNNVNARFGPENLAADVSLTCAPLFHIGGLNVTTLICLQAGGHVVLHRAFDAGAVLRDIARYRVQAMFGAPAMYLFMAQHADFEATDLASVDVLICGGAPVPENLIRLYKARGIKLCQGYGLTETAPFATFLGSRWIESKLGSAGVAPLYGEVRVVNSHNEPLAHGERGEVCVRAPNVMKGYWNRPDATRDAIDAAGWFHTGDVGYFDAEGFLFLCDRVKDMVISGGENVYPAEVESVLYEHPAIAEVSVIGLPDQKWGEAVTAIVRLVPDATLTLEELRVFAGERLARYKLPLKLFLVEEMPRNPAGKVLKYQLRERFAS